MTVNLKVEITNDNCGSDRIHKGLRIEHPDGRVSEGVFPQDRAVRIISSNDVALEALTDVLEFNRMRELPPAEKEAAKGTMESLWNKWFQKA